MFVLSFRFHLYEYVVNFDNNRPKSRNFIKQVSLLKNENEMKRKLA